MQKFTSANTSVNSTKLPKVYRKVQLTRAVLDYGCGKYVDHIRHHLYENDGWLLPYDPYNQSTETNFRTIKELKRIRDEREPLTIVCSNVLNVIDDDDTVQNICDRIQRWINDTDGIAYITVYEGNRSGVGRQTGKDQYQRNEPLVFYRKFFRNAEIKKKMIVVRRCA